MEITSIFEGMGKYFLNYKLKIYIKALYLPLYYFNFHFYFFDVPIQY